MGPWSRSIVAAVAGNAERPALDVVGLRIETGEVWAVVEGCEVTLTALVIPPRIWASMARYAQGMGQLEQAVEGRIQSVHLEHLLQEDWGELLVPRATAIAQACTCDGGEGCEHLAAVAYAFADEIEGFPRVLLRWRGVADLADEAARVSRDPWEGAELSAQGAVLAIPPYAVLERLGPSQIAVAANDDLVSSLRSAYETLATSPTS